MDTVAWSNRGQRFVNPPAPYRIVAPERLAARNEVQQAAVEGSTERLAVQQPAVDEGPNDANNDESSSDESVDNAVQQRRVRPRQLQNQQLQDQANAELVDLFHRPAHTRQVSNDLTADEYRNVPNKLLHCKIIVEYIYPNAEDRAKCGYYSGKIISVHAKSKSGIKPITVDIQYDFDNAKTIGITLEKGNID